MNNLTASRFAEFFRALNGSHDPFPWQQRLAERVCSGHWPKVIALPTAAGKTACIDIALFALACQAEQLNRSAPRRIFFVVDRRIIVDQAFDHAKEIAERLAKPDSAILREVAEQLLKVAQSDCPLDVFQLRGGMYRDDAWARTPLQPTVIASTVDQIGSRLLFRGYGLRSGLARPIHAGLAANDSLIILDEAHCAKPFSQTAEAIEKYRKWTEADWLPPFQLVQMTATPAVEVLPEDIVRDDEEDRNHPELGKRIAAKKPTKLIVAEKAKGRDWRKHLVAELVKQAVGLMQEPVRAVGIIVNRVATAREVCEKLREGQGGKADVLLLTGRMRPLDRETVLDRWIKKLEAGTSAVLDRPLYVVATQCLEVGADLDFHALVSECASLDALRQRFGRLNRIANRELAPACIVIRSDQTDAEEEDPIYGGSLARTWQWLQTHATENVIDMGVSSIREKWDSIEEAARQELNAPALDAPVMFPSHLDCWVQTAPVPCPDPEPAIFLHGPQEGVHDVQVVWRADLDPENTDEWKDIVSLCPPSSSEAMPVPLPAFRKWLAEADLTDDTGDVESAPADSDDETGQTDLPRLALRWRGPDDKETKVIENPQEIRPGDTYVLPTKLDGWHRIGDIPLECRDKQGFPSDLGEDAFQRLRNVVLLRLTPAVIQQWLGAAAPGTAEHGLLDKVKNLDTLLDDDSTVFDEALAEVLDALQHHEQTPDQWRAAVAHLRATSNRTQVPHPRGGMVLKGKRRLRNERPRPTFTDEDDSSSQLETVPKGNSLEDHCLGVKKWVERFITRSGLPANVCLTLECAALWHDLGKADRRFQAWLRGLPQRFVKPDDPLIAKSAKIPRSAQARKQAREQSGYPAGGRHELLSVCFAQTHLERLPKEVDRELFLHLIASHHGHCRPFAPVVDDQEHLVPVFKHLGESFPASSSITHLERLDSGLADRFWKLVRRFGWWGLAYLEAVLRLADHRRSEEEEEGNHA